MRRLLCTLSVTICLAGGLSAAQAGWGWGDRFHVDWHRNAAWMEPFRTADRASEREYFRLQVNNGWRLQNTIGAVFFDETSHELTHAGELKVQQILTQNPVHRRTLFVLMGDTKPVTSVRVQSVQRAASRYAPEGVQPQMFLTHEDVVGGSGEYFEKIDAAYRNSIPSPRLDSAGGSGGAGASGGGASTSGGAN